MPTAPGCHAQLCLTPDRCIAYMSGMDSVTIFTLGNDQIAMIAFVLALAIFALVIVAVSDADAARKPRVVDDAKTWRSDHKL